ncbi:MAG: hypothetical protein WC325_03535 [Candidatus Bathyarchaeia archaeon]|jgi:hypothetical protein
MLFAAAFLAVIVATTVWVNQLYYSILEYEEYCILTQNQQLTPVSYHLWENGQYINITFIALFLLWIPFIDYSLRKTLYPFLKQKLTYKEAKNFSRSMSRTMYKDIHGLVLGYFKRVNRKLRVKISLWFMKIETFEHLHLLIKVFKWIVLPVCVIYGCSMFFILDQNTLDSILLANILFFYSNFVPDLPAIFRRRIYHDERDGFHESLPRYKTYALLLFAPLFIVLVFCGTKIKWKTTETFHNFKSLCVYGVFLFMLGFLVLSVFQLSVGNVIETMFVPLFGLLGYLTHLKVDLIF